MKKPKRLTCRWCGDTIDARNGDTVSAWSHGHPSVCPYRQDRVPVLNGVHVGDLWENQHTGHVFRIIEIRLGGAGVYTDREPVFRTGDVWDPPEPQEGTLEAELVVERPPLAELEQMPVTKERDIMGGETMWFLAEHCWPLTRPDDFPVPWEYDEGRGRSHEWRSTVREWRCPGYRHPEEPEADKDAQYWHAYHTVIGHGIQWERTNVLWQVDPDAEPTLFFPSAADDDPAKTVIQTDTYGESDIPDEELPPSLRQPQPKHEQEALF